MGQNELIQKVLKCFPKGWVISQEGYNKMIDFVDKIIEDNKEKKND